MSFDGSKLLLRQFMRQAIWEMLNRHRPGDKPDIALVGSRRSGSTLLMQVLAHQPGLKSVDQPFSVFTATSPQMQHLPWPAGGLFVHPTEDEAIAIRSYLDKLVKGQIHVQEPWRFWRKDFHFRSDRLVLKTTDAHYLLPLLKEAGLQVILYFRHPVPQALSCARNRWGDKLRYFARNKTFVDTEINDAQRTLLSHHLNGGDELSRYVLGWCLENLPLFTALSEGMPAIFYEDIVLHPDDTIELLTGLCGLEKNAGMRDMLRQSSVSVRGLSDQEGTDAIRQGNAQALVGRWRDKLDGETLRRVQDILDHFPGSPYTSTELTRVKQGA